MLLFSMLYLTITFTLQVHQIQKVKLKLHYDSLGIRQYPSEYRLPEGEAKGACSSSEGRDLHRVFQALPTSFQRQVIVAQVDFHFVHFGEHLADLQESLVLGLWDQHPDVDQRNQTDEGKDDKTVGAQAFLEDAE